MAWFRSDACCTVPVPDLSNSHALRAELVGSLLIRNRTSYRLTSHDRIIPCITFDPVYFIIVHYQSDRLMSIEMSLDEKKIVLLSMCAISDTFAAARPVNIFTYLVFF